MEIHRFEAVWIAASLVLIVGFIATVAYGAVVVGVEMVNDEGGTVDQTAIQAGEYAQLGFAEPGVYEAPDGEGYEVYVVARQFEFLPGTREPIRVPENSRVTFYMTSADVIHGLDVIGTNINVMVIPGQIAKVTVEFDEPAEYGIVCHEYCGAGHHTMEGRLVVVPQSEFEVS